ncbi:MAG: glycosyltransferase [Parvibaculaceae bacterium]
MSGTTVALVMPNYNHARFLEKSLDGLLGQSRPADEIIVIDDDSTDNSRDIIKEKLDPAPNARWMKNDRNMGVIHSMNRLLREAQSDWICFPAADDFLFPDFVRMLEPVAWQNPNVAFVSAAVEIWDGNDNRTGVRPIFFPSLKPKVFSPAEVRTLLSQSDNHFLGQVTLYRRELLLAAGGFDDSLGSGTDGMVLRDLALEHGFGFVPRRLGVWRLHGENYSHASAFNVPKFRELIGAMTAHIRRKPEGFYPAGYAELFARRVRFGVVRLMLGRPERDGHLAEDIADLLDLRGTEKRLVRWLTELRYASNVFVLSWAYWKLWPFSPFRFLLQPFRRRLAEWRVARAS